jgi:hypothetical protein
LSAKARPEVADSTGLSSIGPLRESFLRHLSAENKSASTLLTYGKAVEQFGESVQRQACRQTLAPSAASTSKPSSST